MGMPFGKIRAKVGNFLEMVGNCVKKSDDFQSIEAGQRAKRGKHFAKTVVLGEKHFAKTAVLAEINFAKTVVLGEKHFAIIEKPTNPWTSSARNILQKYGNAFCSTPKTIRKTALSLACRCIMRG